MCLTPRSLLTLLHLGGPGLPIGAFAYSQGLAAAVELGWVGDGAALSAWMSGALGHGLARLDLPVLARLRAAFASGDAAGFGRWDAFLQASRETAELLQEERDLGRSLRRLLTSQGIASAEEVPEGAGHVAVFAAATVRLGLDDTAALLGFVWSWAENQAAVAGKAVPLGQTETQRVLLGLMDAMVGAVHTALGLSDAEIGGALPGLALASCLHETQYSRMFRS